MFRHIPLRVPRSASWLRLYEGVTQASVSGGANFLFGTQNKLLKNLLRPKGCETSGLTYTAISHRCFNFDCALLEVYFWLLGDCCARTLAHV